MLLKLRSKEKERGDKRGVFFLLLQEIKGSFFFLLLGVGECPGHVPRACEAYHSRLLCYPLVYLSQIMQLGFLVLLSVVS